MSHLGYIAYLAMVIALFASPLIVYTLYRGWKRGQVARALALVGFGIPGGAVVVYALMRYGG